MFSIDWILAKVFLLSAEFYQEYKAFREQCSDPAKSNYQIAFRMTEGKLTLYIKHLPSEAEKQVKQF